MAGNGAHERSSRSVRGVSATDAPSTPTARPVRRALIVFIGLLVALAGAALIVLFVVGRPTPNTFEFEIAKAALQVLVVATAGAVVGAGTFYFQQEYLGAAEKRRTEQAEARKEVEQEQAVARQAVEREQAEARKLVEEERDNRRREDDVLRSVLDATIGAYHPLKRERRLLRALAPDHVTVEVYDDVAIRIIDIQLTFEQLDRVAPPIDALGRLSQPTPWGDSHDGKRPPFISLHTSFEAIEGYLHDLVKEYEDSRSIVATAGPAGLPVTDLEKLAAFIAPSSGEFRAGVSYHVDNVVRVIQAAVLEPDPE